MSQKGYPSDEWAFVSPYLTLMREDAPQREHSLRAVFNGFAMDDPNERTVALSAERSAAVGSGLSTIAAMD